MTRRRKLSKKAALKHTIIQKKFFLRREKETKSEDVKKKTKVIFFLCLLPCSHSTDWLQFMACNLKCREIMKLEKCGLQVDYRFGFISFLNKTLINAQSIWFITLHFSLKLPSLIAATSPFLAFIFII